MINRFGKLGFLVSAIFIAIIVIAWTTQGTKIGKICNVIGGIWLFVAFIGIAYEAFTGRFKSSEIGPPDDDDDI